MASPTRRTSVRAASGAILASTPPARRKMTNGNGSGARHAPAPPPATPPPTKSDEIFAAALRLFQEKGYHGASMQDLADAVGMQKASLYYYFRSKEDLLVRVCERGTGAFTHELSEIVASDAPAREKLVRAIECHLVALCEQLDLFTVFLREQKFLSEAQKKRLRGEGERHAELLAEILAQGIRAGEFRRVNVRVTTLAILGMCNWLYEWYSPEGALEPREIARVFAGLALEGVENFDRN